MNDNNDEKGIQSIDWSAFDLDEPANNETSSGQLDEDLDTPVKLKSLKAPTEMLAQAPSRPRMLEYLTDYRRAKISKEEYLIQLKDYAKTQTTILRNQLEATVSAHQTLTKASLNAVRDKVRAWAKQIQSVTDLSVQDIVTKAVTKAAETADQALKQLASMNNPHPMVQNRAMKAVIDTLNRTIANIEAGVSRSTGSS